MEDYISVVTRYVDGASYLGTSPFGSSSDENERMDIFHDAAADKDEQVVAHLIELGRNLLERINRTEKELEEKEQDKSDSESKKDEPEQSMQVHTSINPIQIIAVDSQENSSNEGSSVDGTKLIKFMSSLPTKRGGDRSGGDRGGRSSGDNRGGRSTGSDRGGRNGGSGRGGRGLPPFQNLLTGEGISGEGFTYPIDPRVKREGQ
ncbi:keratin, type I cytoskeletal 10-like [Impatiens glandulifera]|uniref:keratin, type I cytoskeletal 10-like n=1 Tax=Impatiens glandulifera TaxID=253017 RepID=UPI001FB15570|nr:keratin, type I cytoskeletal 10-like [Impatiens glandulifera]